MNSSVCQMLKNYRRDITHTRAIAPAIDRINWRVVLEEALQSFFIQFKMEECSFIATLICCIGFLYNSIEFVFFLVENLGFLPGTSTATFFTKLRLLCRFFTDALSFSWCLRSKLPITPIITIHDKTLLPFTAKQYLRYNTMNSSSNNIINPVVYAE